MPTAPAPEPPVREAGVEEVEEEELEIIMEVPAQPKKS